MHLYELDPTELRANDSNTSVSRGIDHEHQPSESQTL
jgi:hypothetical protein